MQDTMQSREDAHGAFSRFVQRDYSVRRSLQEITATRVDHAESKSDSPIFYLGISTAAPDRLLRCPRGSSRSGSRQSHGWTGMDLIEPPSRLLESLSAGNEIKKGQRKRAATSNYILSLDNQIVSTIRFPRGKRYICLTLTSLK